VTTQTAVFVLGMHRSGTSALTRLLNLLGASLPRHLHPPGIGNETGHWEPEAAVRLHDRLLEAAGTSVNDLYGPPEAWFETRAAGVFVDDMKELIGLEFRDEPLFVFKDPRSALVFPLWRRALADINIRCLAVIMSRNPVEVALSLADRQTKAMRANRGRWIAAGCFGCATHWRPSDIRVTRYDCSACTGACWKTGDRSHAVWRATSTFHGLGRLQRRSATLTAFCPRSFDIIMSRTTSAPVRASGRPGWPRFSQRYVMPPPAMRPTGTSSTRSGDHSKRPAWTFGL
jgi:hypothetical protein